MPQDDEEKEKQKNTSDQVFRTDWMQALFIENRRA